MIRGNRKLTTTNLAIATALLCGTPAVFAQEAATVPEVQTVAPPPVVAIPPAATPTVAPPPMVPTITPTPEATVETPREPVRQRAAVKPVARVPVRSAPAAAPVSAVPIAEPEVVNAPVIDETSAAIATVEDAAAVVPVEESAPTPVADGSGDEWMIYSGLAAALGLAGLGGVIASRRRRRRVSNEPTTASPNKTIAPLTPRPLANQHAAAPVERFTAPVAAPIARPSFADAHLPPVTDPLFAHRPVMAPVTDPLFMHETILPAVTDPMFVGTEEYVGSASASAAFDKRRDWQAGSPGQPQPLQKFEPAA